MTIAPRFTAMLTALMFGAGLGATGVSASAHAVAGQATPDVEIATDKTLVVVGKKVTISGTIDMAKKVAGDRVIVKQRIAKADREWKTQARVRVNANGKFSWTDKPTTNQARLYKVVLPKTRKHAAATSNSVTVTAAKWQLFSWADEAGADHARTGSVGVNGDLYRFSPVSAFEDGAEEGYVEYNLFRKCFKLRGAAALTDASETYSAGAVRVILDGTEVTDQSVVELGRLLPMSADLTDTYRMRVEFDSTVSGPVPEVALVEAEKLCTR